MKSVNKLLFWSTLLLVVLAGIVFRFYNLSWDQGYLLHPDEKFYINVSSLHIPRSIKVFFSVQSPLNPHMFYYGSLPLYSYVFSFKILQYFLSNTFSFIVWSRVISALCSAATMIPLFFLSRKQFSGFGTIIALTVYAFSVGSIQYAHFITTESMLTFFGVTLAYLSFLFVTKIEKASLIKKKLYILSLVIGIVFGLAISTKITGISYIIFPLTAVALSIKKISSKKRKKLKLLVICGGIFTITSLLVVFVASPYAFIDFTSFYKQQAYMQGVILGKNKLPFTIMYESTLPYIYHLAKVFPFIISPSIFVSSIIGFILLMVNTLRRKSTKNLVIVAWPLIYFIVSGIWYAKYIRYMVPLLPFLSLYTAYLYDFTYSRIRYKTVVNIFFSLLLISHAMFASAFVGQVYGQTHTKISASQWLYENIPDGSSIATEQWNTIFPVPLQNYRQKLNIIKLNVYDEENEEKIDLLANQLYQAQYIALSSRLVFYSIQQNPNLYPYTSNFYNALFDDKLGYKLIHSEKRRPRIFGVGLNDDLADESFQSYDHPPVLIYENIEKLPADQLKAIITRTN